MIDLLWSLLIFGRLPTKLRHSGTGQSCCTCVSRSLEIKRQSFNFGVKEHWVINHQLELKICDVTRIHLIPRKHPRPKLETCVKCLWHNLCFINSFSPGINFLYLHNFKAPSRIIKTRACCHLRPFSQALIAALKATMFCCLQWPLLQIVVIDTHLVRNSKKSKLYSISYIYIYMCLLLWCLLNKWWTISAPSHFRLLLCIIPYYWDLPPRFMERILWIPFWKVTAKVKITFPCHPSSICSCRISSKSIKALSHCLPFSQALIAALKAMALQKPDPDSSDVKKVVIYTEKLLKTTIRHHMLPLCPHMLPLWPPYAPYRPSHR